MSKIELKFGRKVVAWEDNVDPVKGRYIKYIPHEREHWVLDDAGSIMPFKHVKPDLEAPPMNGDEVEGLHHTDKWVGKARYIGEKSDGSHMIEVMGLELAMIVSEVRHTQPPKRERLLDLIDKWDVDSDSELVDEILKICEVTK